MSNASFPPENEGIIKPLALGLCFYIPGTLVQAADLIYQFHDGAIERLVDVRDNGVNLVFSGAPTASTASTVDLAVGAVNLSQYYKNCKIRLSDGVTAVERSVQSYDAATRRVTLSANIAITPTSFNVDLWRVSNSAKSQVQLLAPPAGRITAVLHGEVGAASADYATLAELVSYIGQTYGGLAGGDIVTDLATLRAGIYVSNERELGAVLTDLLSGLKSWWGFDRIGKLVAKKIVFPGAASKSLDLNQVTRWDWAEYDENLYQLTVRYRRNNSVMQDVPEGVDPAVADLLHKDALSYTKALPAPKAYQAEETRDTWLTDNDAVYGAQGFCDAAVAEFNTQRHWVTADVPWRGESWDLGDAVLVSGGNAKANGYKLVFGADFNPAQRLVRLTLLG